MRIRWDENKRQLVLSNRHVDFADLENLLLLPYLEDQRSDEPEQYRLIEVAGGQMATFIVEYRVDQLGPFIWVVTAWKSTRQEEERYEQSI